MYLRHVNLGGANEGYVVQIHDFQIVNYAVSNEGCMLRFIVVLGVDRLEI